MPDGGLAPAEGASETAADGKPPPAAPLGPLFLTFLGLGLRAWGGPAAQVAMLREEAVERRGWLGPERFNRLLAVYQILPGPEATEMCVHVGLLRRGRVGAVLAGLGFMLPGLLLMLALAWLYVALGDSGWLGYLVGFAPAVAALVLVACIRLGAHTLGDAPLAATATIAALATALGVPFYVLLPAAGIAVVLWRRGQPLAAGAVAVAAASVALLVAGGGAAATGDGLTTESSTLGLGASGLKAGLLTFGGAYTSIPFLREDAVGSYVSAREFADGIALSGTLPAPLIIFATFLGFVGGGWWGALAMTAGIFLPAFAFTLLGSRHLERLADHRGLSRFLDAVTAAVIGILAATALALALEALTAPAGLSILLAAFLVLVGARSRWATPAVILACGAAGALLVAAGVW